MSFAARVKKGAARVAMAVCLVQAASAAPAVAACALPPAATSSPQGAARWILANNDHVGFARIVAQGSDDSRDPQVLELIYPIKGTSGPVRMRRNESGDAAYVTNSSDRFDAAVGAVLFVALRETARGAVASECTLVLVGRVGIAPLLAALRELDTGPH